MTKTLTSTTDLEHMMDDYITETNDDLDYKISFTKIDFPIENKVNAYIVNLYAYENINKEIGHWILLLTKNRNALIYTCFGLFSSNLLESLREMGYDNVVFDLTSDQPINSKSCGYYCLRYIIEKLWHNMDNYLWFRLNNSNFELISKHIDDKNKPKLKKNNEFYQKTLL